MILNTVNILFYKASASAKVAGALFILDCKILKKDMENYIKLGEAQARLGIGRAITACFKK